RSASARAPVLFPAPAGPSIATITVAASPPRHRIQELVEAGEAYSCRVGALDRHTLAGGESCDRAEHRDPVVAARVHAAAAQPRRDAGDRPPVGLRVDPGSERPQA